MSCTPESVTDAPAASTPVPSGPAAAPSRRAYGAGTDTVPPHARVPAFVTLSSSATGRPDWKAISSGRTTSRPRSHSLSASMSSRAVPKLVSAELRSSREPPTAAQSPEPGATPTIVPCPGVARTVSSLPKLPTPAVRSLKAAAAQSVPASPVM